MGVDHHNSHQNQEEVFQLANLKNFSEWKGATDSSKLCITATTYVPTPKIKSAVQDNELEQPGWIKYYERAFQNYQLLPLHN